MDLRQRHFVSNNSSKESPKNVNSPKKLIVSKDTALKNYKIKMIKPTKISSLESILENQTEESRINYEEHASEIAKKPVEVALNSRPILPVDTKNIHVLRNQITARSGKQKVEINHQENSGKKPNSNPKLPPKLPLDKKSLTAKRLKSCEDDITITKV